ncbi:transport system kinase [Desulfurococcaceae archaeon AG1]|nr:transport system kinase [Desulfurococcaceae archaeon AG1]
MKANDATVLIEKAISGDLRSISRLISIVEFPAESGSEVVGNIMKILMKRGGRAHVIGVTGSPGVGKSTLISKLIAMFRKKSYRVAVIGIDPSSPFSLGSFMGNRIRMQIHTQDPGVFIRSMATRGVRGGLSASTVLVLEALDGLGFDKIIVESVGAGQTDVDIINISHTVLNVVMPGAGDEIQALKAGLMEIGDIYVVNKGDKPEADITLKEVIDVLNYEGFVRESGWKPRAIKVSAVMGTGVEELVGIIEEHLDHLKKVGFFEEVVRRRRIYGSSIVLRHILENRVDEIFRKEGGEMLRLVSEGEIDPYTASIKIMNRVLGRAF